YADVNLDSAAAYYEQLLQTTETHTYAHLHEKNLRELAKIRNHQGQTQEAYKLLDSSYTLVKERYYQNLEDKVAEANAKYEAEKKEAEIARQNLLISEEKNNRRIILITTGIVLVGLVLLGQYLINRQKRQRKETELALYIEQQRAKDMENLAQAKTDLFNNVSHELRTPLTMIIGPLEQALHQIKNIQLKSEVEMALHNSRRLTGLVNEILDLSKLDAGKMEVEMSEVKILTFIRRVFHAFRSLAGSQQIELIDNISENEWENLSVQTDFNKLEKIINNLVSNAIKYCKSDGQVSIHLQYEELKKGILNFSISDQGPGISKEDQAHIFDRYFQAAGNIQVSGTGIGLALTKELVQLLDGMVSVVSDGKNGSTFRVEIPVLVLDKDSIRKVEQASQPPTSPVEPRLTFSRNPRVLIVEDDLQMAKYLKSLLSEAYECTVAYNGRQAMDLLQKSAYDLISSDIMMPEMD
ncbi:MAG: hybrid sensor histidine kinase/response regulator, partial [Saprospiraceae bacterium]|nr:hybrid sensor histidine kinase/response regulator [Saprospiraceae bacterium]